MHRELSHQKAVRTPLSEAETSSLQPEPRDRQVYPVREYEFIDIPLDELLVDGNLDLEVVTSSGYFTLQFKKAQLRLQAGGLIGFIPINDRVALEVCPRCSIGQLGHMLQVGGFAPVALEQFIRSYAQQEDELPALRDIYAGYLLSQINIIENEGRLREYERREGRTSSPRGRLVLGAPETQIAAAGGSPSVKVAWFERTADLPANRCLKTAVWLLALAYARTANLTKHQRMLLRRLNAAYPLFADAQVDTRLRFVYDPYVTGRAVLPSTRSYYRNALDIARLIVMSAAVSFDQPGINVQMPSVVIRMYEVFEDYVRNVLGSALTGDGLRVLDGNTVAKKLLYDSAPSEDATPDIVVRRGSDTVALLDTKYKPAKGDPDRDDVNQIVAYGASYRTHCLVLVQPQSDESARRGLRR